VDATTADIIAELERGIPRTDYTPDRLPKIKCRTTGEMLVDTTGILYPLNTPERDVIPVSTTVNHVADLCICLHSRLQHTSKLGDSDGSNAATTDSCAGTRPDGSPCDCHRMNPVSQKASSHAFKRGQKVVRRRVADVVPGNRVLVGWAASTHGKVRLTTERRGAMVAQVKGSRYTLPNSEAGGQTWFDRALTLRTDLGEAMPISGGSYVLVIK
jgi:hypothetical protein